MPAAALRRERTAGDGVEVALASSPGAAVLT